LEPLLDQGARHSLEMRKPHFKRQFALLLVALSPRPAERLVRPMP
jgi:hypothetical protein